MHFGISALKYRFTKIKNACGAYPYHTKYNHRRRYHIDPIQPFTPGSVYGGRP